jgi:hypothetical protein
MLLSLSLSLRDLHLLPSPLNVELASSVSIKPQSGKKGGGKKEKENKKAILRF